jgi:hypothetical protein
MMVSTWSGVHGAYCIWLVVQMVCAIASRHALLLRMRSCWCKPDMICVMFARR